LPAQSLEVYFPCKLGGVVIGGVGSAFWGVVAGAVALFVQQYGLRKNNS
jgi:benzoate membrane transport protein